MFNLVCIDGEEEPPIIIPEPLMVQVISSPSVISVFFEDKPDGPLVRWSSNPHFCRLKSTLLGRSIVLSLVESISCDQVVGRNFFIEYDDRVMFWISVPSNLQVDLNLNGQPLDVKRAPVYGIAYV